MVKNNNTAISKKICMLGAFSVGKTSLVEKYVNSIFSDKYLSTVGVKISKKSLTIDGTSLTLILWDMEGKDEFVDIKMSYLRGAMGYFTVADVSRAETLEIALQTIEMAKDMVGGEVPHILLLNKSDLSHWEITQDEIDEVKSQGIKVIHTSAKTDMGLKEAFETLAREMLRRDHE